ncbi:MAG: arylsulfotransferase family protein [Myxococcota bacterium]
MAGCGQSESESSSPAEVPVLPAQDELPASEEEPAPGPREAPDFGLGDDEIEALEALGYVDSAPAENPELRGAQGGSGAAPGVNLYSSRHRASAVLTDLDGEVVHRWEDEDPQTSWMHVEPLRGGDLLALARDHHLTRHRRDSSIVWRTRLRGHHDLAVQADGRILVLVRQTQRYTFDGRRLPILADGIATLTSAGEVESTVDLFPLLRSYVSSRRIDRIRSRLGTTSARELARPGSTADVLHTNSIEVLHRPIPGIAPLGSILLSVRELNRLFVLDPALEEVLWTFGEGELQGQHDATQLEGGTILVFDNGVRRNQSRVLEIDPVRREIVWTYEHPDLFTQLRGGAQKLPNGNVLITESDSGHALEVNLAGEVVWEFWNPDLRGSPPERAVIYRLNRYSPSFLGVPR